MSKNEYAKSLFAIVVISLVSISAFAGPGAGSLLNNYNVIWESQSSNPAESMPVGGGDVGLNVWVENDELLFYIGQSGTFDENNHMLKHGRVRLRLDPNPFGENAEFRQELKLKESLIEITGKSQKVSTKIKIWVEVFRPVIHVEIDSDTDTAVTTTYENWRTADREIPGDCRKSRYPCMSLVGYPGKVIMRGDTVSSGGNCVAWYHRNRDDDLLLDKEVVQQELESVKDQLYNPLKGRTFGGLIKGNGMVSAGTTTGQYANTDFKGWQLKSDSNKRKHAVTIYLNTGQYNSIEDWKRELEKLVGDADASVKKAWKKHQKWWSEFWKRSYMFINTDKGDAANEGWQVGKNYQLFRYLQGCNAYGQWPTKFNGSFFTYDPVFVKSKRGVKTESPDFRTWGGGSFTAQNQRLVYWPMLKNGDYDMMPSQFDFYLNALRNAELRTQVYWGHAGCSFTEQLENFGLPVGSCYGWEGSDCRWGARKPGTPTGVQTDFVTYQFGHQLDFSFMILEYYRYSGKDISRYMPFIDSSVTFFDEHYRYLQKKRSGRELDKDGHLVIYPSRGAESYVDANNPADVIAGLDAVLTRLTELPGDLVNESQKNKYREMLKRVPPLPLRDKDGKAYLAGAKEWRKFSVGEIPELYSVFPYGIYGIGKAGLDTARYTWSDCLLERQKDIKAPWYQGGIFAARLGFTDYAKNVAIFKLGDSGERFSAFRQSDDWTPDHNWPGSGMVGLQDMLMQTTDDKIYLFGAWPKDWNVNFKLNAPGKTVIEGDYRNGKFEKLKVTPRSRKKDVIIMN